MEMKIMHDSLRKSS